MRLKDIAALRGTTGLLETLQRTTVSVALIGGVISVLGLIFALMTGIGTNVFYPSVIAAAVLLYAYPRRAAWQSVVASMGLETDEAEQSSKGSIA
jgi:Na+-translocating ferredoxin:NAD+ oxidoreductase RnfD subunit